MPCPRKSVRYSPCSSPSRRRSTVHSTRLRMTSGFCSDTLLEGLRRRGDLLQDAVDELFGRHAVRKGLVREHEAMPEHIVDEIQDVLREDVRAAAHERQRAPSEDQIDRGARTGA